MKAHSFHIPVMGIGFTIDTPLKVSHLGIDSAISLVDDILLEKLRKMYANIFDQSYIEITEDSEDFRAKRITSYLNLVKSIAEKKFTELKNITDGASESLKEYFDFLPDTSTLKQQFNNLTTKCCTVNELKDFLEETLCMGSIDVNIMTKVDKENFTKKEKLPTIYNDAHAALRGFAQSDLKSSVIFSAGMNPRLYSYLEEFEDFYPDKEGVLKKKIVLKVSDYRSALIQGKFLAKKGLWVSEYRIESGLNCGGHAFATDGYLLGPILAQFRDQREDFLTETSNIFKKALSLKDRYIPESILPVKFTAQGGVGTAEEHEFLLRHYKVDSIGWGTPFLLVPEATTVDDETLNKMVKAKEDELYLSDISPLGIPFHSLKSNTKDEEKRALIAKDRPGSSCPKKFVALNKEFTEKGICTASRQYQHLRIKDLDKENLNPEMYQKEYDKITEKSCTCVGLGTSALLKYNLDTKTEGSGVSICPGPNLAYFSKIMGLKEIIGHIYGQSNVIERTDRPNLFIKELTIYITFLEKKLKETGNLIDLKQKKYLLVFVKNLKEGVFYYKETFNTCKKELENSYEKVLADLEINEQILNQIKVKIENS
ncbi:hypothetical protein Celal_3533 [Cellulophaga algicola DSM 14237]|uniref:Uncharacterized protein n=1 Tax=Cellulophaga algicola (strain DSM 14237 / IC166 / ACAM 630) TaxID=688270 RepID=E6X8E1_CELAD|nr:hypothetical protein [Cellulophaga algicola]ADV50797.1 hypothetical protein Celal_3533 [Cellulophaga algicola DSM 14237]